MMTEPQTTAGTTVELSASELETVIEALRMLLDTLGRDDAEQVHEIKALLVRIVPS